MTVIIASKSFNQVKSYACFKIMQISKKNAPSIISLDIPFPKVTFNVVQFQGN